GWRGRMVNPVKSAGNPRKSVSGVDSVLRVGVVGVGVMGSNHARVFSELPGVELVAVAEPDRSQADFVGSALGCRTVNDVAALLDLRADAVSIAAPTHLHRDTAIACNNRGAQLLDEKPNAT